MRSVRGSIQKRAKGSWQIRYDGPPDPEGKRKQVSETIHGTKVNADRVMRERLVAVDNGDFVSKQSETVSEFLHRWLESYVTTNTSVRTQEGYREKVKGYIVPYLGNVGLQTLKAQQIDELYSVMLGRGLSARTVLHTHRILRQALKHAVKWGLLQKNVADNATPPRPERKNIHMWDPETIAKFLKEANESRYSDQYQLAILSGLRRSELMGLRWQNVDLEAGRISIVETLQRISGKGLVQGQPKTPRSRRSVALAPDAVGLLHSVRGRQIEQRIAAGSAWKNTGFVFTQLDGAPVDPELVTHDFANIVRKVGLPHLTFHGLRHAYASLMVLSGASPKVVSDRLGHSSIAVTMDIYCHLFPGMQEQAALGVENVLASARGSRTNAD